MVTNRLIPRNHRIRQEVVLGERVDLTHKMEADRSNRTTTPRAKLVNFIQVECQQAVRWRSQRTCGRHKAQPGPKQPLVCKRFHSRPQLMSPPLPHLANSQVPRDHMLENTQQLSPQPIHHLARNLLRNTSFSNLDQVMQRLVAVVPKCISKLYYSQIGWVRVYKSA